MILLHFLFCYNPLIYTMPIGMISLISTYLCFVKLYVCFTVCVIVWQGELSIALWWTAKFFVFEKVFNPTLFYMCDTDNQEINLSLTAVPVWVTSHQRKLRTSVLQYKMQRFACWSLENLRKFHMQSSVSLQKLKFSSVLFTHRCSHCVKHSVNITFKLFWRNPQIWSERWNLTMCCIGSSPKLINVSFPLVT